MASKVLKEILAYISTGIYVYVSRNTLIWYINGNLSAYYY